MRALQGNACRTGSVVVIATGYGLDGPGIESQWGRDIPHLSIPALGPTQPPLQWVPSLSRGKERRRCYADPSSLLVSWSRKSRAIPLLPIWAERPDRFVVSLICLSVHASVIQKKLAPFNKTGSCGILYWGRLLKSVERSQVCLKSWKCIWHFAMIRQWIYVFLWNCLRLWKTSWSADSCHTVLTCPLIAGEADGIQMCRAAANVLNKQLRKADKGWSSRSGVGWGANYLSYQKLNVLYTVQKCLTLSGTR